MNYSRNCATNQDTLKNTNTWLHIQFDSDISDELGNTVPYPHHHYLKNNRLVYCWLIDGFFGTRTNIEFLNDIIARFKITFVDCKYLKHSQDSHSKLEPLKLKQFQNLQSKAKAIVKTTYQRAENRNDYVFWCIKLYSEDLIRKDGLIIYSTLESWAFDNFIDHCKDRSTLTAKCRSTYNWYFDRDWKIGRVGTNKTKEEIMASRIAHINNVNEKRKENTKAKIENAITGLMADSMFKKKNGTWNAKAIAEYLQVQPATVRKHLKEIEA